MSLSDLQPVNSQKAKATAINVFKRFLDEEHVQMDAVRAAVVTDPSGAVLVSIVDRFGVHLAFLDARSGKKLARHTVMQYFRQAKGWLLEQFPQASAHVEKALLKKGNQLERYCVKRPSGALVKQASACTKQDLYRLMNHVYSNAMVASDYQDAALLAAMWYMFGRASDLTLLRKENLSLCSARVLFVRFVRMKTSEEQGLSLFPDACVQTCPITALAVALAMQETPAALLLPHLPVSSVGDAEVLGPLVPLVDVLAGETAGRSLLAEAEADGGAAATASPVKKMKNVPGIHNYVNRLLDRVAPAAGVVTTLTSHSFRRGGAQAANADADLTLQWIVDRGVWNMATTNKAFNYIFNTTQEDQKVAKVLSRWDARAPIHIADLGTFDALTRSKIHDVKAQLFATCSDLQDKRYNIQPSVIDVLFAYLVKGYPSLKILREGSPLVDRVEKALAAADVSYDELLAWSSHLSTQTIADTAEDEKVDIKHLEAMQHQATVIDELIKLNSALSTRVQHVEAQLAAAPGPTTAQAPPAIVSEVVPQQASSGMRRRGATTNLADAWYAWFAGSTRPSRPHFAISQPSSKPQLPQPWPPPSRSCRTATSSAHASQPSPRSALHSCRSAACASTTTPSGSCAPTCS